jgi:hypothetical protein
MAFTPIGGPINKPTSSFTPMRASSAPAPAPAPQGFFSSAFSAVKNYVTSGVSQAVGFEKQLITHPIDTLTSIPNFFADGIINEAKTNYAAAKSYAAAGQTDTGVQGFVDRLGALTSAAKVMLSPITGSFNAAQHLPIVKQAADVLGVVPTVAGLAASYSTGKVVDIIPDSVVSPETKQILKAPLQDAASLVAQVGLGDRILSKAHDFISKGKIITPEDAHAIVQDATSHSIPHSDTAKPSASFTPISEEAAPSPTTASKPSRVADTSTGSVPTGKEGVSAQKAGTSGPFEGTPVYRASDTPYDPAKVGADGVHVSPSENVAGFFNEGGARSVEKLHLAPDAKILEYKDIPSEIRAIENWDKYSPAVAKYARDNGYDAVRSTKTPTEITVVNAKKLSSPSTPKELYHGSASGKLATDERGNINFGTNEKEIAQFGTPITISTEGLRVKDFATKDELFDAASKDKQKYLDQGYDVLRADNHAIGINPQKISELTGKPIAEDVLNKRVDGGTPTGDSPFDPNQPKSKVGKSIEAKAVENGLTKGFSDTAGYDPITVKDQAERASNFINSSIEDARAVVRGEKPLPEGLRGTALITAMEEHIKNGKDAQAAYELANSPLVSETSAHAQEMRLMAERVPDSLTAKFKEIKAAREAALEKRGGAKKSIKKITDDINTEIKKTASKRPTWEEFAKQISCNY